jgi:predicted alpha/beta superfamily hydrolase
MTKSRMPLVFCQLLRVVANVSFKLFVKIQKTYFTVNFCMHFLKSFFFRRRTSISPRYLPVFALLLLGNASFLPAQDAITFLIDMRGAIRDSLMNPKVHMVGVRGGMPPLRWDSTLVASDTDGDSIYAVTVHIAKSKSAFYEDTRIAYKFKIEGNVFNRGWEMSENSTLNLTGSPQTVRRFFSQAQRTPAFTTMSPRVRRHDAFPSKILRSRSLYVLLPKDYETSGKRYPVLYMHDGQNMFDDSTAANGEWHVDEIAEGLMDAKKIPPMIIVGIGTTGEFRIEEYTSTSIMRPNAQGTMVPLGGRADAHSQMLVKEIKPFIDSVYRTLGDRTNTALGGSSLGGLMTMYTGAKYPNIFGKLMVISPSVWWDNQRILQTVRESAKNMQKSGVERQRIWLDIGDQEGKEALDGARALHKLLQEKGWKSSKTLHYTEVKNAAHSESAWAERLEPMLMFLFDNTPKR